MGIVSNIKIKIHRNRLHRLINKGMSFQELVIESQKLDKCINEYYKKAKITETATEKRKEKKHGIIKNLNKI